jgi:photosystem II stability/assembly factor-like uncharacterized protein
MCAWLLSGCEAPLVLAGVEEQKQATTLRYDQFQAAATLGQHIVVVGGRGAIVMSDDGGTSWERETLPGEPALIDVTTCGESGFAALDINRSVWMMDAAGGGWTKSVIETPETPLTLDCTDDGTLWVAGSFSTLWTSTDRGQRWRETSLNDDLMFTAIQFLDANNGYALGEFGTVARTQDGGDTWDMLEPLPNEFYPLAAKFASLERGWVTGLNGAVLYTHDAGASWTRATTPVTAPLYGLVVAGSQVYATGDHGSLIVSQDGGPWQRLAVDAKTLSYLRGIAATDDGRLVVAGGGGVVMRVDPGAKAVVRVSQAGGVQ